MSEKPPRSSKKSGKKSSKRRSSSSSSPKRSKSKLSEKSLPPPPPDSLPSLTCPTHGKPFTFFSDTLDQPVCQQCTQLSGYGLSQRLLPLQQAFRLKLAQIYSSVSSELFSKRQAIHLQVRKLDFQVTDIQRIRLMIQRDMKGQFSAMNQRLNQQAGSKIAVLEHQLSDLQSDLQRIDFIGTAIEQSSTDMLGFLKKSHQIKESLDVSVTKPVREQISVFPDDLPVQLAKIRDIVQQYPAVQALVAFKDQVIWKILQEKKKQTGPRMDYQQELAQWARLTDKLSEELSRFQMKCKFCKIALDEQTVNGFCSDPKSHKKNGSCHFFVKQNVSKPKQKKVKTKKVLQKVKDSCVKKKISLEYQFQMADSENSGSINPNEFFNILGSLELKQAQIQSLIQSYTISHGQVDYVRLIRDLVEIAPSFVKKLKKSAKKIQEQLKRFDSEQRGVVSQQEFVECLQVAGVKGPIAQQALQIADIDREGGVFYYNFLDKIK